MAKNVAMSKMNDVIIEVKFPEIRVKTVFITVFKII